MNTNQLKHIISIQQTHSFNESSKILYISRQSLINSVNSLEKELGFKLFSRNNHGTFLTEKGQEFITFAEKILNQLNYFQSLNEDDIHDFENDSSLTLKLFVPPGIQLSFYSDMLDMLLKKYPTISLSSEILENNDLIYFANQNLQDGIYFLVSVRDDAHFDYFRNNPSYIFNNFIEDELVVIMSKDHPLANFKALTNENVCKYNISSFSSSTSKKNPLENSLSEDIKLNFKIVTDNPIAYKQSIKSGKTISLIAKFIYQYNPDFHSDPSLCYRKLRYATKVKVYYVLSKKYYVNNKKVLDTLIEILQNISAKIRKNDQLCLK